MNANLLTGTYTAHTLVSHLPLWFHFSSNLPFIHTYVHTRTRGVCSCVIHLCCRLIFQSSSAAVSKRSRGGGRWRLRKRRRAAVIWVLGRLASQHRWRFVWSLPRERGNSKREGGREEEKEEPGLTRFGFKNNCLIL